MFEKLCSADSVEMGIDPAYGCQFCRLRNNAISMSLVSNSFSYMDKSSFGYLIRSSRYNFHSVLRSEKILAAFSNSVSSNDLAGKSLPHCPMSV